MRKEVPVSRNGYLELVHTFADKVHKARSGWDVTGRPMAVQKTKIGKLELKVDLLTHGSTAVTNLKKQLADRDA